MKTCWALWDPDWDHLGSKSFGAISERPGVDVTAIMRVSSRRTADSISLEDNHGS